MKKTVLAISITIFFFSMNFNSITGIQIDHKSVDIYNKGNTLYVGGNGSGNYSKIQDAIDNASDGDTVFVYDDSSPYNEWEILINESINLIGEDKDTTIISAVGYSHVFEILKGEVSIEGFSISDSNESGIYVDNTSNITIFNNNYYNCSYGIFFWNTNDVYIISNSFEQCREGAIYFSGYDSINNLTISDNYIYGRAVGYLKGEITILAQGYNHIITNNTLMGNNKSEIGLFLLMSYNSIIQGNIFSGFTNNAVTLRGINVTISHNYISYNSRAIDILGNFNDISHNHISYNHQAFFIWGITNKISYNNIIKNTFDVEVYYMTYNIYFDGNYWDSWIGIRIKLPIFQRFPKIIRLGLFKFAIDWHPAKEPYNIKTTQFI